MIFLDVKFDDLVPKATWNTAMHQTVPWSIPLTGILWTEALRNVGFRLYALKELFDFTEEEQLRMSGCFQRKWCKPFLARLIILCFESELLHQLNFYWAGDSHPDMWRCCFRCQSSLLILIKPHVHWLGHKAKSMANWWSLNTLQAPLSMISNLWLYGSLLTGDLCCVVVWHTKPQVLSKVSTSQGLLPAQMYIFKMENTNAKPCFNVHGETHGWVGDRVFTFQQPQ